MDEKVLNDIIDIIKKAPGDHNGKYSANIGKMLNDIGIDYKELGYRKLKDLFEDIPGISYHSVVLKKDKPPVGYVDFFTEVIGESPINNSRGPKKNALLNYAYLPRFRYKELADLALPENWYFGNTPRDNNSYRILESYLNYTFVRLQAENKVLNGIDETNKIKYSAFNTGLVDKKYEYIFALFKEQLDGPSPWALDGFYIAGQDWGGKLLVKLFNPLPKKADYFEGKISNMLFDSTTGDLIISYDHIITERINRFPYDFIRDNSGALDTTINQMSLLEAFNCSDRNLKESYFKELGNRISNDPKTLKRMTDRLKDAVEFAKKRVEWNYKTAIPSQVHICV